jgi:transcriptional regulator with XRE-family HTH domain
MEVHEKIKFLRLFKGWSQEQMAEKLQMSLNGYAKIEHGKVDICSKLEKISEILGVEVAQLFGLSEKNVCHFLENSQNVIYLHNDINHDQQYQHNAIDQTTYKHELEKANLIIEQQKKEIEYLNQDNEFLKQQLREYRDIINILKTNHDD